MTLFHEKSFVLDKAAAEAAETAETAAVTEGAADVSFTNCATMDDETSLLLFC